MKAEDDLVAARITFVKVVNSERFVVNRGICKSELEISGVERDTNVPEGRFGGPDDVVRNWPRGWFPVVVVVVVVVVVQPVGDESDEEKNCCDERLERGDSESWQ